MTGERARVTGERAQFQLSFPPAGPTRPLVPARWSYPPACPTRPLVPARCSYPLAGPTRPLVLPARWSYPPAGPTCPLVLPFTLLYVVSQEIPGELGRAQGNQVQALFMPNMFICVQKATQERQQRIQIQENSFPVQPEWYSTNTLSVHLLPGLAGFTPTQTTLSVPLG